MPVFRPLVSSMLACSVLTACAGQVPGPAIPDPPAVFAASPVAGEPSPALPVVFGSLPEVIPVRELMPEALTWKSLRRRQRAALQSPQMPGGMIADERLSEKPQSPETVLQNALRASLVRPTARNYFGGGASTRYTYQSDRLYEVLTNPENPTVIRLPQGEHVMHDFALDQRVWWLGTAVTGEGAMRQENIFVQPKKSGLTTRFPLLCQSGRSYYVLLRSTETLSMAEVTWTLSPLEIQGGDEEARLPSPPRRGVLTPVGTTEGALSPRIDVSRIHTAWKIETIKGKPAWVPISAYDDGARIIIVFRESLQYTVAPATFVVGANGKPAIVETTPWEDGVPGHGAYYIVSGLYPVVLLDDGQGGKVRLTRISLQSPPYREVSHAPLR